MQSFAKPIELAEGGKPRAARPEKKASKPEKKASKPEKKASKPAQSSPPKRAHAFDPSGQGILLNPSSAPSSARIQVLERADGAPIVNVGPTCGGLVNLGTLTRQ